MGQDLLKISIESFELQIFKLANPTLKDLYKKIIEYKWENGKIIEAAGKVGDIERKQSIIEKELIRRGYLKPDDYGEFNKWWRDQNYKKKIF